MAQGKKKTKKKTKKLGRPANTDWHDRFTSALQKTRHVGQACAVAGVGRRTAYHHKADYPDFAEDWDCAIQCNIDDLEASAMRRAIEGYTRGVYSRGEKIGEDRYYETALTIFMLKCQRPERYNIDNQQEGSLTADQTAAAVRGAIEAMRATIPSAG